MFKFWKPKKGKELKPKHSIWKTSLNARKPFRDTDKDKVIDIFDCQPRNKRKQGEGHHPFKNKNFSKWKQGVEKAMEDDIENFRYSDDDEYAVDRRAGYRAAKEAQREAEED